MNKLRWAIYRVSIAADYYEMCCADVWREFQSSDPDLAKEVEKLGLTEEGTAEWICPSPSEGMASPAELLADGRRDLVIERIRRATR